MKNGLMEDNDTVTYGTRSIFAIFKNFFENSKNSSHYTLSPPEKYDLESVINCYSSFRITDDFNLIIL